MGAWLQKVKIFFPKKETGDERVDSIHDLNESFKFKIDPRRVEK